MSFNYDDCHEHDAHKRDDCDQQMEAACPPGNNWTWVCDPNQPIATSCTVVKHKPRCVDEVLCATLRIPNRCRIEKICVDIIGQSRRCGKLIVFFQVRVFYLDCCGCVRECCRSFRNCFDEVGFCPFNPCINICGKPRFQQCGCFLEVKLPIQIVWK
jgi:hypothetical protein